MNYKEYVRVCSDMQNIYRMYCKGCLCLRWKATRSWRVEDCNKTPTNQTNQSECMKPMTKMVIVIYRWN